MVLNFLPRNTMYKIYQLTAALQNLTHPHLRLADILRVVKKQIISKSQDVTDEPQLEVSIKSYHCNHCCESLRLLTCEKLSCKA